jgi:prepilin-type N-terminal cleavage/methylation domain-containing protein
METPKPVPRQPPRRRAGFSLLEVMIALGILTVGVLAATSGQILAMRTSSTSRTQALAMHLAEQQMEVFRGMSAADVKGLVDVPGYPNDPSNPIDPDPEDADDFTFFTRRWLVQPDTPKPDVITVTVEVDWTDALSATRTMRLQSLKADR